MIAVSIKKRNCPYLSCNPAYYKFAIIYCAVPYDSSYG